MKHLILLATLWLLSACSGSSGNATVTVRLVSDYAPGAEVLVVGAELRNAKDSTRVRYVEQTMPFDATLLTGYDVARIALVPYGDYEVDVALRSRTGAIIAKRTLSVTVKADATFTVHMTSSCADVSCPTSTGGANTACMAGQCVDPHCTTDSPSTCPADLFCDNDADCGSASTSCATMKCSDGVCLETPTANACESDQYCAHGVGCTDVDRTSTGTPMCNQVCTLVGEQCWHGKYECGDEGGTPVCVALTPRAAGTTCTDGACDGLGHCVASHLDAGVDASLDANVDAALDAKDDAQSEVADAASADAGDANVIANDASDAANTSEDAGPTPVDAELGDAAMLDGDAAESEDGSIVVVLPDATTDEPDAAEALDASEEFDAAAETDAEATFDASDVDAQMDIDAAIDASIDAGVDAAADAVVDAAADVPGWDAPIDLGPPTGDVVQITTGYAHSCALMSNGSVRCWGDNQQGQLGYHNLIARYAPGGNVYLRYGATQIIAGDYHTCALLSNQTVRCWGGNGYGQLGYGDQNQRTEPMRNAIAVGGNVTSLAAGAGHTCALLTNGSVKCWGDNTYGQLGTNASNPQTSPPTTSVDLGSETATAIFAGGYSTCAILSNGALTCWGDNSQGQLGYGDTSNRADPGPAIDFGGATVRDAFVSTTHACAWLSDGSVRCWGQSSYGQLGYGDGSPSLIPGAAIDFGSDTVTGIGHSMYTTCAMFESGATRCWGMNTGGQLGYGDATTRYAPPTDGIALGAPALQVTGSADFACALMDTGAVQCWGTSATVQSALGYGNFVQWRPQHVELAHPVEAVSVGTSHICAQYDNGELGCWGSNTYGELGLGDQNPRLRASATVSLGFTPTAFNTDVSSTCVTDPSGTPWCWGAHGLDYGPTITDLGASFGNVPFDGPTTGSNVLCGVTSSGEARCIGNNYYGHLGYGDWLNRSTVNTSLPINSGVAPGTHVAMPATPTKIDGGHAGMCALLSNGKVTCWGAAALGVGGGNAPTASYVDFGVDRTATKLDYGGSFACVVLDNGEPKCWGGGVNGELGHGVTANSVTPVSPLIGSGHTATDISVGDNFGCALRDDGAVYCWGQNYSGQLGRGTANAGSNTPAAALLPSGRTATQITSGPSHTCALLDDGSVACWGTNSSYQLGDGTSTQRNAPIIVAGTPSSIARLYAGQSQTCALTTSGELYCWGYAYSAGRPNSEATNVPPSYPLPLPAEVTSVFTGQNATCAVLSNGTVACWGYDNFGYFGDGAINNNHLLPTDGPFILTAASNIVGIGGSSNAGAMCIIQSDGAVDCIGQNGYGQLGYGDTQMRLGLVNDFNGSPRLQNLRAIDVAPTTTCAVNTSDELYCWGANNYGQLGYNDLNARAVAGTTPVDVGGGVAQVSTSSSHTCARLTNGTVKCWGYNGASQLGDGSTTDRIAPRSTPIALGGTATSISAYAAGACALLNTGVVKCWGSNTVGECGADPTLYSTRSTPVTVALPRPAIAIDSNPTASVICALLDDRNLYCWGYNYYGQLGDGTAGTIYEPAGRGISGLTIE